MMLRGPKDKEDKVKSNDAWRVWEDDVEKKFCELSPPSMYKRKRTIE